MNRVLEKKSIMEREKIINLSRKISRLKMGLIITRKIEVTKRPKTTKTRMTRRNVNEKRDLSKNNINFKENLIKHHLRMTSRNQDKMQLRRDKIMILNFKRSKVKILI